MAENAQESCYMFQVSLADIDTARQSVESEITMLSQAFIDDFDMSFTRAEINAIASLSEIYRRELDQYYSSD
jgi:hypothetical protein